MSVSHQASCLCGCVQLEIVGELGEIGHCHCRTCQKMHGAAYGTYVNVVLADLKVISGSEEIGRFDSSPGITRTFCKNCGSTLQFIREGKARIGLAAGCFDSDLGSNVDYEIWTSSAAEWGQRSKIKLSHTEEPGAGDGT